MTANEIINTLENSYINSSLIYEKMFAHFVNLTGFGFQIITVKQGSPIYRARYTNTVEPFRHLSEMSYPQKSHVKFFSRLNRPCQNMFYASESESACLTEMLPFWFTEFDTNDKITVTLGKWIVREDIRLLIIPDTKNKNEKNKKILSQLHPSEIEFWDYISNKFKTSTKDDENIYEFTAAFGNALWLNADMQDARVNGFIYSSVQSKENLNLALSVETIDNDFLVPSEFLKLNILRTGYNKVGLPTYKEIDERTRGLIDLNIGQIDWI